MLALGPLGGTVALLCDPARSSCSAYQNGRVLTPSPASFRGGGTAMGGVEALSALIPVPGHWGFADRGPTTAEWARAEAALARAAAPTLPLLVAFGVAMAALLPWWRRRRQPGWSAALGRAVLLLCRLLCIAGCGLASLYLGVFFGLTETGWLAPQAAGALAVLAWRWHRHTPPTASTRAIEKRA